MTSALHDSRATSPRDDDRPLHVSSPFLVGRHEERVALVAAMTAPPALILVEGEAGVGKTRLIREVLADQRVRRRRVLAGHCHPLREPFPLGPLIEAVRTSGSLPESALSPLVGALHPLLPEFASSLPPPPAPLHDARSERHRVFRALAELLTAFGPAVCVLEDVHWADETTLEFLRFLLASPPPDLALVCAYRREELRPGAALPIAARLATSIRQVRVTLEPLGPADVRRLIGAILDADHVSEEFSRYLHDRASGLPFAVEEILGLLQERRDLVRRDGHWARNALDKLALPEALRDSILERVDRLAPDVRLMVQAMAVAEQGSDDTLIAVAGLAADRGRAALSEALRAGFLRETDDGGSAFRHVLAREAVYGQIPGPQRRALHLAVAQTLEQLPPPLPVHRLAHHYRQAQRPEQWAHYAELAADVAASLYDEVTVCRFLQVALAAPGLAREDRVRLAVKLGNAAMHSLNHDEAAEVIRGLLDSEPLEAPQRGELRRSLGVLLVQAGDASAGVSELRRAVPELHHRPAVAMRAAMSLAVPWVVEGDVDEHMHWLEQARALRERHDDPVHHVAFVADEAAALLFLADARGWEVAEQLPRQPASVDQTRETLRGYLNVAQAALWLGHHVRAQEYLERYGALAEEPGSIRLDSVAQTTHVLLDFKLGRWQGLEERARSLCDTMTAVPHACADVDAVLGCLLLAHGEVEEARERLERLLGVARASGSIPVLAVAAAGLARLELSREEPHAALTWLEPVIDILAGKGVWGWATDVLPVAVEALSLCDEPRPSAELAARFAAGLAGRDAPAAQAALETCRAHLAIAAADEAAAVVHAAAAHARWSALPAPYEAARACELRAAAQGVDESTVPDAFDEALEAYDALGATWEVARVRQRLRSAGVAVSYRWRGGRRGYGNELSPREEEVVALVAQGLTNREIATQLFVSPRTVEFHVAKAMRKLGAVNRRELAALLADDEA